MWHIVAGMGEPYLYRLLWANPVFFCPAAVADLRFGKSR